ncbi:thioredoxin [Streptomyces beijiangensis]|uniref:Thioredoxin n=1 Tax=Streptomyces beijiangensis TaxID=163361 RepID=A0A939FBD2_9ACTN|nr:thioredoxin [Streptomyces beijiangensis]MBO0514347.1 thioredoxin [Streptomyces beijiangensis]
MPQTTTPTPVLTITDAEFADEVLASDVPVLVDFTAAWCGPCRMLSPVLDRIAEEAGGRLKIVKLDVDTSPATPAAYGVLSMPTLMVFQNGEPVKSMVGARPQRKLVQELADVVEI